MITLQTWIFWFIIVLVAWCFFLLGVGAMCIFNVGSDADDRAEMAMYERAKEAEASE